MKSYTFDGMDFFSCYGGFSHVFEEVRKTGRPVLIEVVTERFRGHSISDPGLYRSKEELEEVKQRDPIPLFVDKLKKHKIITDKEYEALEKEQKDLVIASMKYAEESPLPELTTLEEDVFAP